MSGVVGLAVEVPQANPARWRWRVARVICLAVFAWLGYHLIPIYYHYYDFRATCMLATRDAAVQSDEEIKRTLVEALREKGLEKQPRDIGVKRVGRRVTVWFTYTAPFQVSVNGRKVPLVELKFTPSAEGGMSE